jgi:hypothetical protein
LKTFKCKWSQPNHRKPLQLAAPLAKTSDDVKKFILQQIKQTHARENYLELLTLAASMDGLDTEVTIRKPGAMHRARWMAKDIYSIKMERLFLGIETVLKLTARKLKGIQSFNQFVILIYLRACFTSRSATDAAVNAMELIQRLNNYPDDKLQTSKLKQ